MSSSLIASVPKLRGRENYEEWAFAAENFLLLESLQSCVNGTETDAEKITQARAKLILTVDTSLYIHIKETKTAAELWNKLKSLFADNGFARRISLLRTLISTRLEDCQNMAAYVNQVVETSQRLQSTGFKIDDEWVGSLLLAGLSDKYSPMIMAIEHSGMKITADAIKTKLLDIEFESDKTGNAFAGKSKKFSGNFRNDNISESKRQSNVKNITCYKCKQKGHYASKCPGREKHFSDKKTVKRF